MTFEEIPNNTERSKDHNSDPPGFNNSGNKYWRISGKSGIARGGKKSNITLKGREGHFKASTYSWVSLVESVEGMVNIISFELANEKENKCHKVMKPD